MNGSKMSLLLAALVLAGCPADGETDAADTDAADTDTDGATDLCAPQAASTATIAETQLDTTYPTPAGGTIADGTYDLERFEVYAPATADDHVRARRLVVEGGTIVSINVDDGVADPIMGGTWSASGTDLSLTITCPSSGAITLPYTASGEELWLFDPSEPNVQVYARQ